MSAIHLSLSLLKCSITTRVVYVLYIYVGIDDFRIFPMQTESHFWRRKMRTLHSHLDVNKDGVLSYDDFMLLGDRFAKMGHLSAQQKEEFQKVLGVSFRSNTLGFGAR